MKRIVKEIPIRMISLLLIAAILFAYAPITGTYADATETTNAQYEWANEEHSQLDFHNSTQTIPLIEFASLFGWTKPTDMLIKISKNNEVVFVITDVISDVTKLTQLEQLENIGISLDAGGPYKIEKGTIVIDNLWPFSYHVNWSEVTQFSVSVYDTLTVVSNKPDVVSVDGSIVTDTLSKKVYRGELPSVNISFGDLINYKVTAKIEDDIILSDAGEYKFGSEFTGDTTVNVVYVEDKESEFSIGVVSGNEAITYPLTAQPNQKVDITISPNVGYYVDSVEIKYGEKVVEIDNATYHDGVWSGGFTTGNSKLHYTINCITKPILSLSSNGISYNDSTTIGEIKTAIFNLIDKGNSSPLLNSQDKVTVKYNAAYIGTDWKDLDYIPSEFDLLSKHAFGWDGEKETIQIAYIGDGEKYTSGTYETEIYLSDNRSDKAAIDINDKVEFTYGAYTKEDILDALLNGKNGVYDSETGNVINGEKVELVTIVEDMWAGEHTVKVRFAGNADYKGCEATATLVIRKATVEIDVNSTEITYGDAEVTLENVVSTNPDGIANVTFIAGLNAIDGTLVTQVDISDLMQFDGLIGEVIDQIIDSQNGTNITLNEFRTIVNKIAEVDSRIDLTAINELLNAIEKLEELEGVKEIMLTLSTDGNLVSQNVGVYIVGSVIADANYVNDFDVGYIIIKPNATKVTLYFNQDIERILSINGMQNLAYDLGTNIVEDEYIDAKQHLTNVFIGFTEDGEFEVSNEPIVEIGAYTQIAYINNFDNKMYYAIPIARAYAVLPDSVTITFIGSNDDNIIKTTYDGEPQYIPVVVTDKNDNVLNLLGNENLNVIYVGVMSDGTPYRSNNAPTNVGIYSIIAVYNDERNQIVGFNTSTLIVEAADSGFELKNTTVIYDGTAKFVDVVNPNALPKIDIVVYDKNINLVVSDVVNVETKRFSTDDVIAYVKDAVNNIIEVKNEDVPTHVKELLSDVSGYTVTINDEYPIDVGKYEIYSIAAGYNHKATLASAVLTIEAKQETSDEPDVPTTPTEPENPEEPPVIEPSEPTEPSTPIEPTAPSEPGKQNEPTRPDNGKSDSNAPQTGDDTNIVLWSSMFAVSGIGLLTMLVISIMQSNKGKYLVKSKNRHGKYLKK